MNPQLQRLATACLFVLLTGALGLRHCPANEVITSVSGTVFDGVTNETFGYEFTVGSQPLSVNALGIWDPSFGAGLNYSHDVGLWDAGGNLLTSVTIPSGNSSTLSASGFWYEPISVSLTLSPNTTYVLGAKYPFVAPDIDTGLIWAATTSDPEVTFGTARRSYTMAFVFPADDYSFFDEGYFGPNMDYTVVPEPATGSLLGLGLLALARLRRPRLVT